MVGLWKSFQIEQGLLDYDYAQRTTRFVGLLTFQRELKYELSTNGRPSLL